MAALSAIMAASAVAAAGASYASAYAQSQGARAAAEAAGASADVNARFAEVAAEDALDRGEKEAAKIKRTGKRITGAQRAAMAAQGLDPDAGSGLDLQLDTAALTAVDALTVRNNAWREAWGYRVQAVDATARGQYARIEGGQRARSSLLVGGLETTRYGLQAGYHGYQNLPKGWTGTK